MSKSSKPLYFEEICKVLDSCYPNPEIPLKFTDAYTLLVAVVLSAQCTDKRVNEVTPKLWAHGMSPQNVIDLGIDQIREIIRPCGLYMRKAESIWQLSRTIQERYDGKVPQDRKSIESLPGVGRKTANVILSHIYGIPAFPVDTHVLRLAQRWGWTTSFNAEGAEKDLCELFPESAWLLRHLQMIYFGRNYCKARGHEPNQCPACCLIERSTLR